MSWSSEVISYKVEDSPSKCLGVVPDLFKIGSSLTRPHILLKNLVDVWDSQHFWGLETLDGQIVRVKDILTPLRILPVRAEVYRDNLNFLADLVEKFHVIGRCWMALFLVQISFLPEDLLRLRHSSGIGHRHFGLPSHVQDLALTNGLILDLFWWTGSGWQHLGIFFS